MMIVEAFEYCSEGHLVRCRECGAVFLFFVFFFIIIVGKIGSNEWWGQFVVVCINCHNMGINGSYLALKKGV
jgi:hypothetical protein